MKKMNEPIASRANGEHRICRIPKPSTEVHHTGPTYLHEMTWRIFRIMAEFVEGFEFLSELNRAVSIFGSARISSDSHWYKEAEKLGRMLGECGFTLITGGGPGIMEAANKGATDVGAESVGLNIQLPNEQRQNPYVKKGRGFHYFFTRKVMLASSSDAYVFFPGGIGTMNEFFEILEMIQTKKMQPIPVVLVGKEYWRGFLDWQENIMCESLHMIEENDLRLFHVVDSAEEAFDLVSDAPKRILF